MSVGTLQPIGIVLLFSNEFVGFLNVVLCVVFHFAESIVLHLDDALNMCGAGTIDVDDWRRSIVWSEESGDVVKRGRVVMYGEDITKTSERKVGRVV